MNEYVLRIGTMMDGLPLSFSSQSRSLTGFPLRTIDTDSCCMDRIFDRPHRGSALSLTRTFSEIVRLHLT